MSTPGHAAAAMSTPGHAAAAKWLKTCQQCSTESLVATSRKWIEECTGCFQAEKNFTEYLQDGVVLCELVQSLMPGMIRKINRNRNSFAWRENISFFLGACSKLGLKEGQLFAPEDIIATTTNSSHRNLYRAKSSVPGGESILRRISLTICHLALALQSQPDYSGPHFRLATRRPQPLQLSPEEASKEQDLEPPSPHLPSPSFSSSSFSSSVSSSSPSIQFPAGAGAAAGSTHNSPSSPVSLVGSSKQQARRVESVSSLITETSSTDCQSYAELVLYLNGSNKEYTRVSKPAPIRLTQSFNSRVTTHPTIAAGGNKAQQVHRTLSDRTPFAAAKLPHHQDLQESVSDNDIAALQNGVSTEFAGSRESFEAEEGEEGEYPEYRDFDSITTPSDASTVIFRELLSSRCSSNLPVPTGEDGTHSVGGSSYESSPIGSRHFVAAEAAAGVASGEEEGNVKTAGLETSPQFPRHFTTTIIIADSNTTPVAFEIDPSLHEIDRSSEADVPAGDTTVSEVLDESVAFSELEGLDCSSTESPPPTSVGRGVSALNTDTEDLPPGRKRSSEQVTDICDSIEVDHHNNHSHPTPSSRDDSNDRDSGGSFCGNGLGFERSLEHSTEGNSMDSYLHYQHNSSNGASGRLVVVDSEPIGMVNGVRTQGYASNEMKPPPTLFSATSAGTGVGTGEVPHHSLTLASSDPESPSSCQIPDSGSGSDASSHHQNFDVSSLASLKNQVLGLDISRVQSDALPHSLLPSMIVCENMELDSRLPRMMADARSIDTCSTDDMDQFSAAGSPRRSCSPQQTGGTTTPREREFSPGGDESTTTGGEGGVSLAGGGSSSQGRRPMSAPNRVISAGAMGRTQPSTSSSSTLPPSSTLLAYSSLSPSSSSSLFPSNGAPAGPDWLREKQKSLDVERQKRVANIQAGARAALQYSAKRKTSRPETLPRDSRSHTRSILSTYSDTDLSLSTGSPCVCKASPPPAAVVLPQHESSSSTASDVSASLNLRHLSMEQTKEASLTQMDEIWKQVEAIGDRPSERRGGGAFPSLLLSSLPAWSNTDIEDNRNVVSSPSLDPKLKDVGTELERSVQLGARGESDVLKDSDIFISVLQPIDQSTPLKPPALEAAAAGGGYGVELRAESSLLGVSRAENHSNISKNRPTSFSNQDIDSLLHTLKSLSSHEEDEDLRILEDMLKSNTFKKAKQAHDDMRMLLAGKPAPAVHRIVPSTQLMRQHLHHHTEQYSEVEELRSLLRSPHVQAALFCHDKVSSHDLYVPDAHFHQRAHDPVDIILSGSVDHFQAVDQAAAAHYQPVVSSRDAPFNRKEGATIVYLERTNRPLGCTIYKQEDSVFVGKLLKGCDAEASDMLREGDELLEVNGVSVMGMRTDEVVRLMSGDVQSGTTLAFTIIPVHDESYDIDYEPKYMRAHFNYEGTLDSEVPCKALGLSFQKGDIMEIVNQDDPQWWQACKVFEESAISLPGLIPSMHLQQQREALVHSYSYSNNTSTESKKGIKAMFSRKKKKKIYYQNTPPSNVIGVGDEIPTYEQVIKLEPDPCLCRPIVLIGAPGVGRRTLIRKLMNSDPSLYHPVVQHTSRLIRPGEVNSHDYHFVTKDEFERDIEQDRFLEYGEHKGHYYGTGFSSMKTIMEAGHVPVLDLHPQALKKIRHSGVRPYIVFVGAPRLERLQLTRKVGTEKLKRRLVSSPHHSSDAENTHVYTESDLQHLVKESYLIENQYGHYFDWIIVNDDFHVAADMLKEVSRRLECEPQWVPYAWKNY